MMTLIVSVPDFGLAKRDKVQEEVRTALLDFGLRETDCFMLTLGTGHTTACLCGAPEELDGRGLKEAAVMETLGALERGQKRR